MENKQTASYISTGKGLLALSPIVVFLLLYVAVSVIIGDFYKMWLKALVSTRLSLCRWCWAARFLATTCRLSATPPLPRHAVRR